MLQLGLFSTEAPYNPPPKLSGTELGRARIQEIIDRGKARAARVIEHVQANQPVDQLIRGARMDFDVEGRQVNMRVGKDKLSIHRHALGQILERCKMPIKFMEHLQLQGTDDDPWGAQHVAGILTDTYQRNYQDTRFLSRSVQGQMRGFLSDHYKRYRTDIIVDSFAQGCQKVGAVAYEGYVSDTTMGIQAVLPTIYEPINGEIIAYGASLKHSDFGNGALDLLFFTLRLQCLNGMIGQRVLRRIHKGSQLEDNVVYSKKTYELDSKTLASAIQDMIQAHLSPERIELGQEAIRRANAIDLGAEDGRPRKSIEAVLAAALTVGEVEAINKKFNEPDVELLPPGNSVWRLSNAVSWLASQTDDEERKMHIQAVAGKLLPTAEAA